MLKISWKNRVSNTEVLKRIRVKDAILYASCTTDSGICCHVLRAMKKNALAILKVKMWYKAKG